MGTANVKTKKPYTACPDCGNQHQFKARSEQVCEDGCEIWVECNCGYNPFNGKSGYCIESVMGDLCQGNVLMALDSWNELIAEL